LIDDEPVFYMWQRQHYIYWCTALNRDGFPAHSYKMLGIADSRGRRKMVFRYDPDFGYNAFLKDVSEAVL
jgi:hypothetical protein